MEINPVCTLNSHKQVFWETAECSTCTFTQHGRNVLETFLSEITQWKRFESDASSNFEFDFWLLCQNPSNVKLKSLRAPVVIRKNRVWIEDV